MSEPTAAPPSLPSLACLDRAPAPPTLVSDFEALLALPEGARAAFWEVLGPCLDPALGPEFDRVLEAFARKHDALPSRLAVALRGTRFLLTEAARYGVDEAAFSADLARLGGDRGAELRAVLAPGFAKAVAGLRSELVRNTILDHGALLAGVAWRVDRVLGSQHGRGLDATLGVLTLTVREGASERRITLHCEPGMLATLRAACGAMLD